MNRLGSSASHKSFSSGASVAVMAAFISLLAGCGDAAPPAVYIGGGGSGGSGGTAGVGATGGSGGEGGFGSGGAGGSGGVAGHAGEGGTGGDDTVCGSGGTGGGSGLCVTTALCHTCPDSFLCDTDDDCSFSGYLCVASGCTTNQGAPIKQCLPSWAPSCQSVDECPNATDYDCIQVGSGSSRCVRIDGSCDPATESYDCAPGFSCEGTSCVDRRVPCESYLDCPKSHICHASPNASFRFCAPVHRTCHRDEDCSWLGVSFGRYCADVDGDLDRDECAGESISSPGAACVSSDCQTNAAPVCEAGLGGTSECGQYGLCLTNDDCVSGFECLGLGLDGRKECVPINGSCDRSSECPLGQVCAAPRRGGLPSCQPGLVCEEAT